MLVLSDLPQVAGLLFSGMMVGGLLSFIPWAIGFVIEFFSKIILKGV